MAIFKCKMCGEPLNIEAGGNGACTCSVCGTHQTVSRLKTEKIEGLFGTANHLRRNNEFDVAMGVYQQIITEDPEDSEAYWGVVLCRYGVEYVTDPATKKKIPTVNRTQYVPIFDDDDFQLACDYAREGQFDLYMREAQVINKIQKGILEISSREEPFDVFICYKETDADGRRTEDSVIAQELHRELERDGLKVFYARVTLEDKLGSAYEPYIFSALNSARVMVVIGTRGEYINAAWVRNEWSRYLTLIKNGKRKHLIPAYKGMDPYELPKEFAHIQGQDLCKLGAMQDLIHVVNKLVNKKREAPTVQTVTAPVQDNTQKINELVKRGYDCLEVGSYEEAKEFANQVIALEYENAHAYAIIFLANLGFKSFDGLKEYYSDLGDNVDFLKALKYADADFKKYLSDWQNYVEQSYKRATASDRSRFSSGPIVKVLTKAKAQQIRADIGGVVYIPEGTIELGAHAFEGRADIKKVVLPSSLSVIKNEAFKDCLSLGTVNVPSNVIEIYERAFEGCKSLVNVRLPDGMTRISQFMFANCRALTDISFIRRMKEIDNGAFYGCESIKEVVIAPQITKIGQSVFEGCKGLKTVELHSDLYEIGEKAFSGCESLAEIQIPESVSVIGKSAFAHCGFTSLPKLPSRIMKISEFLFEGCSKITEIEIPEHIREIGEGAFAGTGITKIPTLPPVIKEIGARVYKDCLSLLDVEIPAQIREIGDCAFEGCLRLKSITIPDTVGKIGKFVFMKCKSLTKMPKLPTSITTIPGGMMKESGITSLEIPSHITQIGAAAFESCMGLSSVTIPEGITDIGEEAFERCGGITEIVIPQSVESVKKNAFSWCGNLESVVFLGKECDDYAFYGCVRLTKFCIGKNARKLGFGIAYDSDNVKFFCQRGKPLFSKAPSGWNEHWHCTDSDQKIYNSKKTYAEVKWSVKSF